MTILWQDYFEWNPPVTERIESITEKSVGVLEEWEIWYDLNPRVAIEGSSVERQMRLAETLSRYRTRHHVLEQTEEVLLPLVNEIVPLEKTVGASYRQL